MLDILYSIAAFTLAIGVLITFHEFGHYWVARKCGVKVLRFSVGFGAPLLKRKGGPDQTEYVLAAIPLGGYVKMLDEREGEVAADERHRAFNHQSLGKRFAIVAAGPLANFLLAIAAYWLMFLIGISGIAPIVGTVDPHSVAARAGLLTEDRIVAVDGETTTSWAAVRFALLDGSLGRSTPVAITVVDKQGSTHQRLIDEDFSPLLQRDGDLVRNMGLGYWWPTIAPIIAGVQADSPAERAGLRAGDRFVSLDGEPVDDWMAIVHTIRNRPGKTIRLEILRDGVRDIRSLTPARRTSGGAEVGYIGVWQNQSTAAREQSHTVTRYGPVDSLTAALQRSWQMSLLTVRMLGKLLAGQVALSNVSGPVSIAHFAGQSAAIGLDHYLSFIAIISISLGVLNLLPVPLLDGGHLLFFIIEWVKGSPPSAAFQLAGQYLGIALIGSLMLLALYNDLWRLWQ